MTVNKLFLIGFLSPLSGKKKGNRQQAFGVLGVLSRTDARGCNCPINQAQTRWSTCCELARHPVVLKVDDWVFCHGGLLPHHVTYGIERMNREVSDWMRGVHEDGGVALVPFVATRGYDSVVWNRLYSRDIPFMNDYQVDQVQSVLQRTLQEVGAKAFKYDCRIWCIGVGMSRGVLNSRPEVLEIKGNIARAIRSGGDASELQILSFV